MSRFSLDDLGADDDFPQSGDRLQILSAEEYEALVREYPSDPAGPSNLAFAYFFGRDMPRALEIGRRASPVAVETVSGDITAWVDAAADVTVFVATSGEITTDYTIAIENRYHEEPAKVGRIAIGSGATDACLTSRRGAVRVLRAAGRRATAPTPAGSPPAEPRSR